MTDEAKALVERLRLGDFYRDDAAYWEVDAGKADALCDQAADRIEQLTAEVERLRGLVSSYRLQIDQLHDRATLAGDSHDQ